MRYSKKRGFLQISFAWLFGIIAGAVILALAIFLATRLIGSGQYQTSSEAQKQISVLLNPLETSFQTGQVTTLSMSAPTRIYNQCNYGEGVFGQQTLSISQESFSKWSEQSQGTSIQNRYIFSNNVSEGRNFFLFTKPFNFPFKVADLIYLTPESTVYCFVNPPPNSGIGTELSNLKQKNIFVEDNSLSCPVGSLRVCFNGYLSSCQTPNITIDYSRGTVKKEGELSTQYFSGNALMYAAIFSDSSIYNCQLKRLMQRENELSKLYLEKLSVIQKEGCTGEMSSDLSLLGSSTESFSTDNVQSSLNSLIDLTNKLQKEDQVSKCPLW